MKHWIQNVPKLTGLILGLTLHTTPAEIFRTLVEATAFGARMIIERFKEYGIPVDRVIKCGGISVKSPMTMQIYADVLGCTMEVSDNEQSCALGAAMAGAVVGGVFPDFAKAAGCHCIGIASSFSPETLLHAGADHVVPDFQDIDSVNV